MADPNSPLDFVLKLGQQLMELYWGPMYGTVRDHPELVGVIPGFLIKPEEIIFYLGRTHIGIEYVGPLRLSEFPTEGHEVRTRFVDYTGSERNIFADIVGIDYGSGLQLPLTPVNYDLVMPTNAGMDEMHRLGWNWTAQEMIVGINTGGFIAPSGQFTRVVNGRFYDADKDGLRTRYVRWLDLIPCTYDDSGEELDMFGFDLSIFRALAEVDPKTPFPLPDDFRLDRLQKLNRFVEAVGDRTLSEPDITRMLSKPEYDFILRSRFAAREVQPEVKCEWQSAARDPIQPDFFVIGTDGYADIVEFKLPALKGDVVVGRHNRESFSAEVNSYISQTRSYRDYFDDPNNRAYIFDTYGFKVYRPRRIVVMGRRWDLNNDEWRAIAADYTELTLLTYDDLIDGVVAQFYDAG